MANGFQQRLIAGYVPTGSGFRLEIRLPWYRSLPLSTVELGNLQVDGKDIDPANVAFEVNGKRFPVKTLGDLVSEWWFILDSGYLHVTAPGFKGDEHAFDLTINLYPPYIPALTWVTRAQRTLRGG